MPRFKVVLHSKTSMSSKSVWWATKYKPLPLFVHSHCRKNVNSLAHRVQLHLFLLLNISMKINSLMPDTLEPKLIHQAMQVTSPQEQFTLLMCALVPIIRALLHHLIGICVRKQWVTLPPLVVLTLPIGTLGHQLLQASLVSALSLQFGVAPSITRIMLTLQVIIQITRLNLMSTWPLSTIQPLPIQTMYRPLILVSLTLELTANIWVS